MEEHIVKSMQASRFFKRSAKHSHSAGMLATPAGLLALAGCIVLAGCGSSSKSGTSSSSSATTPVQPSSTATTTPATSAGSEGAAQTLKLTANAEGQLKYDQSSLTAKAGKVSIDFTNSSPVSHNVTVESSSGESLGATESFVGGSKTLSLKLKAGTYKFFCSVAGHRQAGMEGTLTVH
jgi:plastocyanin